MTTLSDNPDTIKFVHTYGVGLHSNDANPDVHDPHWQKRQIDDFVEFAMLAEDIGFDGLTVTEHHAPLMTCPSPHLLLAAAAVKTSRIRLGSAVTVLPLYHPLRVAEEAGTLDLLSNGRFELGLGRGGPGEAQIAVGNDLSPEELNAAWLEGLDIVQLALTQRDFTYEGAHFQVTRPTSIATRPIQRDLPVWLASSSLGTVGQAAARGWNTMRNFGTDEEHRAALDHYVTVAGEHGHERSGANVMVERFVAIGETEAEANDNLDVLSRSFSRFISIFTKGGRQVPDADGEFALGNGPGKNESEKAQRPALAIVGTPDQIIDSLQQTIDATGARRLLIETFSHREARLFAHEVMPAIREKNRAANVVVR